MYFDFFLKKKNSHTYFTVNDQIKRQFIVKDGIKRYFAVNDQIDRNFTVIDLIHREFILSCNDSIYRPI